MNDPAASDGELNLYPLEGSSAVGGLNLDFFQSTVDRLPQHCFQEVFNGK
jgi:hypothetical protein